MENTQTSNAEGVKTITVAPENTITTSKQFSINFQDIGKGLIVAIGTPILLIIQQSIAANSLTFNWKEIVMAGIGGLTTYLLKNFFTPAQTIIKPPVTKPTK